ncbi:hypothetical protein N7530_003828 [Penicillium desertorum]|uniref:Uncharacterized protein n=1 Tax=Penicillium desertorum TaxID=1303715 RepID=A0A9W9WX64_9EURO|nr:hypothetical protein N7530_003828 [Penicillium desertorum]
MGGAYKLRREKRVWSQVDLQSAWNHEKWGFATRRDLEAEEVLAKKDLIIALPGLPITVFNVYN